MLNFDEYRFFDYLRSFTSPPRFFSKYCFANTDRVQHLILYNPGPKSHEISLENLTQIFRKSSYDPRRRYEAHRRRDIKKISSWVLFEIFRRSSIKFFMRSSWDLKKIFWRFIRRLAEDFIRRSSEDLLTILKFYQNFFQN